MRFHLLILGIVACLLLPAAEVPPCESPAAVRGFFQSEVWTGLARLPWEEQIEARRGLLSELQAKYPLAVEVRRRSIDEARWWDRARFPALLDALRKRASERPDDPLAAASLAYALWRSDTAEAIRLLEALREKWPMFGWPALLLSNTRASGRYTDPALSERNLRDYFNACPDSLDTEALDRLGRSTDTSLVAQVAAGLRARLSKESDPTLLRAYSSLWGLEFRAAPPSDHDDLRHRVATDVARIAAVTNGTPPTSGWLVFMRDGLKQAGAPSEALDAIDSRILSEFPRSREAYLILYRRWSDANPEPEDQQDAKAWQSRRVKYRAQSREWAARFPEIDYPRRIYFYTIQQDPTVPRDEAMRALDTYIRDTTVLERPSPWNYRNAAQFLLLRGWEPGLALDYLNRAAALLDEEKVIQFTDTRTPEDAARAEDSWLNVRRDFAADAFRAARLAGRAAGASVWETTVEGPPPRRADHLPTYWQARAEHAWLAGRKAAAAAYFQAALHARTEPPRWRSGRLTDELTDEARSLWRELGGDDESFVLWTTRPAAPDGVKSEGRWEAARRPLPPFNLPALDGRTWTLKQLEGRSVLINLWATWCGPCLAELPHLEKLWLASKGRADVQILSFNLDEDLGLVAPFLKEHRYTFPVVPAYAFVNSVLEGGIAIPQNWIVDPRGKWRYTQFGFDSAEPDFSGQMLRKLESVRISQP